MKTFLAFLLLSTVTIAATDTLMKPVRLREVSLKNVPLKEGERIASLEVEVAGASFSSVRIPLDWSFDVGAPVSGVATLKGGAGHGVGMPFTTEPFQRFLTLAFYDYRFEQPTFSIKVKIGLYLLDQEKGESQRVVELPVESVVLEAPNQAPEPTPGSVTPRAK